MNNFSEKDDSVEEIASMPGISRFGINQLIKHLEPLVKKGLKSVLLFGVIDTLPKVLTNFIIKFSFNIYIICFDDDFIISWIKLG